MDSSDILRKFEVFLADEHKKQLIKAVRNETAVVVDFHELEKFDPAMADHILENPYDCIDAAEEAISNIDTGAEPSRRIHFRIFNLPKSSEVLIRNIRSKHLGKFIAVRGIIKQASEVRPEITAATWECQACGEKMLLLQEKTMLQKPYLCECGNKRGFELVSRKLIDVQRIILEESPELLEGGSQTRKISVYLRDDMVDPTFQKRVIPGNEVIITGVVNDIPIKMDRGEETKKRDIYIDGNYLDTLVVEYAEIEITKKDEKAIKKLSKTRDIYKTLIESIAPSIYGYETVKEAIALQLFGGHRRVLQDGMKRRGDIHILLVGDPGSGKSQILKYVTELAPKGRYIVGKSASGAGITAAAVKDEFTGQWALEAGALVLANKGLAGVDEMDKMTPEDRSSMHEIMEQQTCTISKASIQATLAAQTTILAAANPKFGRFDPFQPVPGQINMPATLISRFDLIFPIKDIPDKTKDMALAEHILAMQKDKPVKEPPLDKVMLRKYIAYAKKHCKPVLTDEAIVEIRDFYVNLRGQASEEEGASIPLTARQLEALVRLSEASARIRLSNKVERADAKRAIKLLTYCLQQVGMDTETGMFDIDMVISGTPSSQRNKIREILRIMKELQDESPNKLVAMQDLIARAEDDGIDNAEEIVQKLRKEGEVFEPKQGYLRKV